MSYGSPKSLSPSEDAVCPSDESTCESLPNRTVNISGWAGEPCSCGNGSYLLVPMWDPFVEQCSYYEDDSWFNNHFATGCELCSGLGESISIYIICEDGLWYVRLAGFSWGSGCDQLFDWSSEGRAGSSPPTGTYNMTTDNLEGTGGSDCPAPVVSLS